MKISQVEINDVLTTLKKQFPNPGAMELGGSYRTLVGVILSARTRDEQVLKTLPDFFAAFPTVQKLAAASEKDIQAKVNTIGLYRNKAKSLKAMAQGVASRFDGTVPTTMEDLTSLAGVGRKTASVILVACCNVPAIAVDTHVHRVTNRIGWVKTKTPAKTEKVLLGIVPPRLMRIVNRVFVKFGRYICIPGRPRCWMCPIRGACRYQYKNLTPPKDADAIREDIERRENELERLRKTVIA